MKIFLLCFALFLALGVSLPAQEIISDKPEDQPSILSKSVSTFSSKLYEKISEYESENGNIMFSPLGLHMLLFQIYLGAPKDSCTRCQFHKHFLHAFFVRKYFALLFFRLIFWLCSFLAQGN